MTRELDRLRNQLRHQKLFSAVVGVVALLSLAATLGSGLQSKVAADEKPANRVIRHEVLQAERFELVNSKGELLAVLLENDDTGKPVFSLVDKDGNPKLGLALNKHDQPLVSLQDDEDRQRLRLYVTKEGAGRIDWLDEDGNKQIEVEGGEFPRLYMRTGTPYGRVMLNTTAGGAKLRLVGEDGDSQADIGVGDKGDPKVELWDKDGESIFTAP